MSSDEYMRRIIWAIQAPEISKSLEKEHGVSLRELGFDQLPSEEAFRFALLGFLSDKRTRLDAELDRLKPGPGRPRKNPLDQIDAKRAFTLWSFAHCLIATLSNEPVNFRSPVRIKTRDLIELAQTVEAHGETPTLFPNMTSFGALEQSVSRGRKVLQIDRHWVSENLLKILGLYSKNDGQ